MTSANAKRIQFVANQHLKAEPEAVFPLLCPVREYDWIPEWDCSMIYTDSGVAELDCIFTTRFPDEGDEEVWVVDKYAPPREIQFIRVNRSRVIRYRITLRSDPEGGTHAEWRQVITSLDPNGGSFMERYTPERFSGLIQYLESLINHYLTTGHMPERSQTRE